MTFVLIGEYYLWTSGLNCDVIDELTTSLFLVKITSIPVGKYKIGVKVRTRVPDDGRI